MSVRLAIASLSCKDRKVGILRWLPVLPAVLVLAIGAGCASRSPSDDSEAASAGSKTSSPARGPAPRAPDQQPPGAPSPAAAPTPARLAVAPGTAGPGSQCLGQIEAFAERHTGNRVMLGKAAFADSDRLVLTREPHRGNDGRPLDGRAAMPQPLVLNLLAGPEGCSVRLADAPAGGSVAPLPACRCAPLSR